MNSVRDSPKETQTRIAMQMCCYPNPLQASVWEAHFPVEVFFLVGLMHCSRDPQVPCSATFSLKLGLTTLFTHLKIILLQCFQFSIFSNKQYPNRSQVGSISTTLSNKIKKVVVHLIKRKKSSFYILGLVNKCHQDIC